MAVVLTENDIEKLRDLDSAQDLMEEVGFKEADIDNVKCLADAKHELKKYLSGLESSSTQESGEEYRRTVANVGFHSHQFAIII